MQLEKVRIIGTKKLSLCIIGSAEMASTSERRSSNRLGRIEKMIPIIFCGKLGFF